MNFCSSNILYKDTKITSWVTGKKKTSWKFKPYPFIKGLNKDEKPISVTRWLVHKHWGI